MDQAQEQRAAKGGHRVCVCVIFIVWFSEGKPKRLLMKWGTIARHHGPAPSPLVGEGWGGGSLLLHDARAPTTTPTPNPPPPELGFTRVRHSKWPKSDKSHFGWGGEPTRFASRSCIISPEFFPPLLRRATRLSPGFSARAVRPAVRRSHALSRPP